MRILRAMTLVAFAFALAACGGGGGASQALPGAGSGSGAAGGAPITPPNTTPSALQHACPPAAPGYMTCYALIRSDASVAPLVQHMLLSRNATAGAYSGPLRPVDIASIYGVPTVASSVPTIAIVDAFDDPNAEADLAYYRQWFNLPPCTTANGCFEKLNASGSRSAYPTANSGWAGEISLDLDAVSATCPRCRIVLVEAADNSAQSLGLAEDTAAALNPNAISNSYGGPEYQGTSSHYTHPNTIITASTGDDSFYGGAQQPASYASVVAVGGTSLYADSANPRGWDEFAWGNTGSGCSTMVARPVWQNASVTGCANRAEADVAAFADPFNPGLWVWNTYTGDPSNPGGWYVDGGTSAAAPLLAAMYGLAGNSTMIGAHFGQSLYTAPASSFNDITHGNNGFCTPSVTCSAGVGYDGPTGVGTPNGLGGL